MLTTQMCDLLGLEAPIVQAAIAPFTSRELAAAVANAGGLGSLGTVFKSVEAVRADLARIRELTERPFAVNFTRSMLDEQGFVTVLEAHPPVISIALGAPGELVRRA